MVGVCGPVRCIDGIRAVGGVSDEHADARHEAGGEGAADVVGGLVYEGGELLLVSGVEQEKPETIIGVHDFDFA